MLGVLIIPTGIGAEIGGHAGDGSAAAKLIASVCDTLILHPNVVNASDINEMPENCLYVEGSFLDRFLEGKIELKRVKSNKVLVAVNKPARNETINAVSAARATIGLDASIIELETPLTLTGYYDSKGRATGEVTGWMDLVEQVKRHDFDALAITSPIIVDREIANHYIQHAGVNPWGGVEAIASRLIANALNKPTAHAPTENEIMKKFNDPGHGLIVDPRIAAEIISRCYIHCVLKGLHKAPRIGAGISVADVDFLVTPVDCVGRPHHACLKAGIPVIAVKENTNCLNDPMPDEFILVDNYLEATGLIAAMRIGVSRESVRRPLGRTFIYS